MIKGRRVRFSVAVSKTQAAQLEEQKKQKEGLKKNAHLADIGFIGSDSWELNVRLQALKLVVKPALIVSFGLTEITGNVEIGFAATPCCPQRISSETKQSQLCC